MIILIMFSFGKTRRKIRPQPQMPIVVPIYPPPMPKQCPDCPKCPEFPECKLPNAVEIAEALKSAGASNTFFKAKDPKLPGAKLHNITQNPRIPLPIRRRFQQKNPNQNQNQGFQQKNPNPNQNQGFQQKNPNPNQNQGFSFITIALILVVISLFCCSILVATAYFTGSPAIIANGLATLMGYENYSDMKKKNNP